MQESVMTIIESTALFKGISSKSVQPLLGCLNTRIKAYKKGQTIFTAADSFKGIGIVIEGQVMVSKARFSGTRLLMTTLSRGDIFGEMVCFLDEAKYPADITAITDATIAFVSPEKVIGTCQESCQSHQMLIKNLLKMMSKKAMGLNRKVNYLSLKTLKGKISAFLLEQAELNKSLMFQISMNRDEWAEFFNVSRPSLSRELSLMKSDAWIDYHKSSFKILDQKCLQEEVNRA